MFHPAKVISVFSPGNKNVHAAGGDTQVLLKMWDKNMFTFDVHPKIADKVKNGDIVLVDYRPIHPQSPVPRHLVMKVLKGKSAKDVWEQYQGYLKEKKDNKKEKIEIPASSESPYHG